MSDEGQLLSRPWRWFSYFLGECVRFWSQQQRTLAPLLGKQCFSWGFPEDRCPWWGFWVQYNFDSCLHWKNKFFQGQMTLATGRSGGCTVQHAAEQSSVEMIWAPAKFERVNLRLHSKCLTAAMLTAGSSAKDQLPHCTRFPVCR